MLGVLGKTVVVIRKGLEDGVGDAAGFAAKHEISASAVGRFVPELTVTLLEEHELIRLGLLGLEEGVPALKFLEAHVLPVVEPSAADGLLGDVEAVGLDEDEFGVQRHASAPDAPGVTGNLGRMQNDTKERVGHYFVWRSKCTSERTVRPEPP